MSQKHRARQCRGKDSPLLVERLAAQAFKRAHARLVRRPQHLSMCCPYSVTHEVRKCEFLLRGTQLVDNVTTPNSPGKRSFISASVHTSKMFVFEECKMHRSGRVSNPVRGHP